MLTNAKTLWLIEGHKGTSKDKVMIRITRWITRFFYDRIHHNMKYFQTSFIYIICIENNNVHQGDGIIEQKWICRSFPMRHTTVPALIIYIPTLIEFIYTHNLFLIRHTTVPALINDIPTLIEFIHTHNLFLIRHTTVPALIIYIPILIEFIHTHNLFLIRHTTVPALIIYIPILIEFIHTHNIFLIRHTIVPALIIYIPILIEFIHTHNLLKLKNDYYLQIKGTTMGIKMAPEYANISMDYIETLFLSASPQ